MSKATFHLSCYFKWCLRHFGLCSCHSLHLYRCNLAISVKLTKKKRKTVQNAELILSVRCQTDDPLLVVPGFTPSVKNWNAWENMSERHSDREKQASSNVTALHSSSDTDDLKKYDRAIQSCSLIS